MREHIATIERTSGNTLALLQGLTGLTFGLDPEPWSRWWAGWNQSEPPFGLPAQGDSLPAATPPPPAPASSPSPLHRPRLATGTLVWTLRGKKAVESLRVGDRVLSQDPSRGALSFQGIVAITAPAPDSVLRLHLDGGSPIILTPLEAVWKAGEGWVLARDLKPGDAVRVCGGRTTVVSLSQTPTPRRSTSFSRTKEPSLQASAGCLSTTTGLSIRPSSRSTQCLIRSWAGAGNPARSEECSLDSRLGPRLNFILLNLVRILSRVAEGRAL